MLHIMHIVRTWMKEARVDGLSHDRLEGLLQKDTNLMNHIPFGGAAIEHGS